MIHPPNVVRYPGTLTELTDDLGNLRYDALAELLRALESKIERDAIADAGRGRHRLAAALGRAGASVRSAAAEVELAWSICAPHMPTET